MAEADILRRSGDLEGALAAYAALREGGPEAVRAHLGYVRTASEAGRRSQAREDYRRRAALPGALEVERVLAERLEGDQSTSALRALYDHAAAREPDSPWWPLGLAEVSTVVTSTIVSPPAARYCPTSATATSRSCCSRLGRLFMG